MLIHLAAQEYSISAPAGLRLEEAVPEDIRDLEAGLEAGLEADLEEDSLQDLRGHHNHREDH